MYKGQAGTIALYAYDSATGLAKTGDSANLKAYLTPDLVTASTQLTDTSASEISSANAPGYYGWSVLATEANFDFGLFTGTSTTAGIGVVGQLIQTISIELRVTCGVAQNGGNSTITLASGTTAAQAQPGFIISLDSGTGAGQLAPIDSVDFTTPTAPVATLGPTTSLPSFQWAIANPQAGTGYSIFRRPGGPPASIPDFWNTTFSGPRVLTAATNLTSGGTAILQDSSGNVITSGGGGGGGGFHGGISL